MKYHSVPTLKFASDYERLKKRLGSWRGLSMSCWLEKNWRQNTVITL